MAPRLPKTPLTDEMKARRNQRLAMGGAFLLLAGGLSAYFYLNRPAHVVLPTPKIEQKTDVLYPTEAAKPPKAAVAPGSLKIDPPDLNMGTVVIRRDKSNRSFVITALNGSAKIDRVGVAFAQESGLQIDAASCLAAAVPQNNSCNVGVIFDPQPGGHHQQLDRYRRDHDPFRRVHYPYHRPGAHRRQRRSAAAAPVHRGRQHQVQRLQRG